MRKQKSERRIEMTKKGEKQKADKPANKVEPFETVLRCKLTGEEMIARGTEMAESSAEVATLEDTLSSVKKEYQAKIDAKQARINELSGTIMSKLESRVIKCERTFLYGIGKVTETRTDTNEVINTREMRDDERQMEMAI
jgi:hypothetical protein